MSKQKEYVYVPLSYEYMMSFLFGNQQYHGHVGSLSGSNWKKDLKKINKYIKKSININIKSDSYHKSTLINLCDNLDEKLSQAKCLNEINVGVVESYVKLIFSLMGNFPNHWDRKAPYGNQFWDLNGHRTMSYSQTDEQKAYLIIHLVDIKKSIEIELMDHKNMHEAFWSFGSDPVKFMKWFKSEYPRVYCELF